MQKVKLQLSLFLSTVLLFSCASLNYDATENYEISRYPYVTDIVNPEIINQSPPKENLIVAVYPTGFTDLTGQRKSNSEYADFSTAVTQGPANLLIKILKDVSNGQFFTVVERIGLENLTKERQIIRSARQNFEDDKKLGSLLFAGMIFEGGVVSYENNVRTGGQGARVLGLGATRQYRQDTVTISLRLVSVLTGRVMLEQTVTKTILSVGTNQDAFRFVKNKTELVEIENGNVENESVTIALQSAIEEAVLRIIEKGFKEKFWSYDEITINACADDVCPDIRG